MALKLFLIFIILVVSTESFVIDNITSEEIESDFDIHNDTEEQPDNVFDGVYTECFLYLSYSCLQKKTLLYLKELDKLSEVSVIGEYVKFVKVNETENEDNGVELKNTEELSFLIDKAVDRFFNNHILKFNAMGKDIGIPQSVEEFVGRKRKGGGGGGHGGGDDGGKKKMMMMAMMCMKMKFMMMVPAMMGMMGMMSFKGMMFSMMSFMLSKMMLLMKLLEKRGGGGGSGGGDGGWAAGGGGGGGAWMPAGGQDFGGGGAGGGGGGGGYDANGQWQSRSIIDNHLEHITPEIEENKPIISYVTPVVRYGNNVNIKKSFSILKNLNNEVIKINQDQPKPRKKRGIVDVLQNAYLYWINQVLGMNNHKNYHPKYPKYKLINGVKYVYYPIRQIYKTKTPKELSVNKVKITDTEFKPIITAEDFNKGEIVEGPVESRMNKKKMKEMKDTIEEVIEDSPWQ